MQLASNKIHQLQCCSEIFQHIFPFGNLRWRQVAIQFPPTLPYGAEPQEISSFCIT